MPHADTTPTPRPGVVFRRVPDGAVLYASDTEIYFGLNAVGAEVWELLPPASASVDALVQTLAQRHPETSVETIRTDVDELLQQLAEQSLVVMRPSDDSPGM